MLLEPTAWAAIALSAPNDQSAWQNAAKELSKIGFDQGGLVYDYQMFKQEFPSKDYLLGDMVSPNWDMYCRDAQVDFERIFDVVTPSSMGIGTYVNPEVILSSDTDPQLKKDLGILYELGLKRGWTTPVRDVKGQRFSVMMLSASGYGQEFDRLLSEYEKDLELCVTFLVEALDLKRRANDAPQGNLLSPRERECLAWASLGRSAKQISDKLNLAQSTVTEYLSSATQKLGATNRSQAVAKAIMLNIIQP